MSYVIICHCVLYYSLMTTHRKEPAQLSNGSSTMRAQVEGFKFLKMCLGKRGTQGHGIHSVLHIDSYWFVNALVIYSMIYDGLI